MALPFLNVFGVPTTVLTDNEAAAVQGLLELRVEFRLNVDDKQQVTEHKLLMERQDNQMKNMLSMCMRTLQEMKNDTLLHVNSSNHTNGAVKPDYQDVASDSESEELTNHNIRMLRNTAIKTPSKRTADSPTPGYSGNINQKRKPIVSSTPLPPNDIKKEPPKLSIDQATQTDDYLLPQISREKFAEFESVLHRLYQKFLNLVAKLNINFDDDNEEQNGGTAESDKENECDETAEETNGRQSVNNSNVEANIVQPHSSGKSLQVRRVSAHTTNNVEQNVPLALDADMVPIGAGYARVPARLMDEINWNSYSSATRQLLQAIFPRKVLATHSLTGKQSPAFTNKPAKKRLNRKLVDDIVETVSDRCGVPKRSVRAAITIKCTDEAKLYRNRLQIRSGQSSAAQDNVEDNPSPGTSHSRPSSNDSA